MAGVNIWLILGRARQYWSGAGLESILQPCFQSSVILETAEERVPGTAQQIDPYPQLDTVSDIPVQSGLNPPVFRFQVVTPLGGLNPLWIGLSWAQSNTDDQAQHEFGFVAGNRGYREAGAQCHP